MVRNLLAKPIRSLRDYLRLPEVAKAEYRQDCAGLSEEDPGIDRAIDEATAWLCRAQDCSVTRDGGLARHFSLVTGWGGSYPETTGYIVPTLLAYGKLRSNAAVHLRAKRMLNWLAAIQLPSGGFQGGTMGATPVVPVTFNTGQILLGFASGAREFGEPIYRNVLRSAADWLVETQDPDGCWRQYPTPFALPGEKTYDPHAAWGLLEASRIEGSRIYAEAALANVHWSLKFQRENGMFDRCCLTDPSRPLTHTLGYTLRGIVEAYRFTEDPELLRAARKTANGLLKALGPEGFLPGRLFPNWRGAVSWACLTGSVQIACCWLLLYQDTGDIRYRDAAYAANRYVRRTIKIDGPPETRGGIKGSFPVYGGYGAYEYLNWACKFFIDSNMLERATR